MPSAITRTPRNRANRRVNGPNRPRPSTPIGIVSVTKNVAVMTIVFNQPVNQLGETQQLSLVQQAQYLAGGALTSELSQSIASRVRRPLATRTLRARGQRGSDAPEAACAPTR